VKPFWKKEFQARLWEIRRPNKREGGGKKIPKKKKKFAHHWENGTASGERKINTTERKRERIINLWPGGEKKMGELS